MIDRAVSKKGYVLIYTRIPVAGEYSAHLANSAHLAYSADGKCFRALNRNYGILYAAATFNGHNSPVEKGLTKPYLFHASNGQFGVIAVRINADGSRDEESKGRILLWISKDLYHFKEIGLICLRKDAWVEEAVCRYDSSAGVYIINWRDSEGNLFQNILSDLNDTECVSQACPGEVFACSATTKGPEGAVNGNILQVDGRFGDELMLEWTPLENVSIRVPDPIEVSSEEEIRQIPVTAVYSDGSTALKRVEWETDGVDFSKPGVYDISGTVIREEFRFPLAAGYADPDILRWDGRYYFIATNDNTDDVGLYVRESNTVAGLFEKGVREYRILDRDETKGFVQTFWAPEFHVVGGELHIFFAVGGRVWGPQSHVMRLKKNGRIIDPDSWEEPVRIRKRNGDYLTTDGITLDMTYLCVNEISYLIWSYRIWKSGISSSDDSGSMLYIATIDPAEPWRLTSEPVLLSRPLFGWENNMRTINNEGPYAIVTEDFVYVTYSGGAAGGYTYVLGLLSAGRGSDLLDPKNWAKSSAPVLSHYSVKKEYGPGHNSFYVDEQNNTMIAYHAQESLESNLRCTGIRRVHFNIRGVPVFDLSSERDLKPELSRVQARITLIHT